jgi:hypothetical protein
VFSDSTENNTLDALVYVYPEANPYTGELTNSIVYFLPPQLENNLLTRLQLLDGYGLEHFELVKNFGNQIKVYKVVY